MFTKMNEILSSGYTNEMALGSKSINVLMQWLVQQVRKGALLPIHMDQGV